LDSLERQRANLAVCLMDIIAISTNTSKTINKIVARHGDMAVKTL